MTCPPAYNALMTEVCVGKGWCGGVVDGQPRHVDMFIPESGPVTADQFVDWLFEAEGLTGQAEGSRAELRKAFTRHMGCDVVDAQMLKWDVERARD